MHRHNQQPCLGQTDLQIYKALDAEDGRDRPQMVSGTTALFIVNTIVDKSTQPPTDYNQTDHKTLAYTLGELCFITWCNLHTENE